MSYTVTLDDQSEGSMGCLADVKSYLRNGYACVSIHIGDEIRECRREVREACLLAMGLIPEWEGHTDIPEYIEVYADSCSAYIHSLLAPFRPFIEMNGAAEFYLKYREHNDMGAFITSHMAATDVLRTEITGEPQWIGVNGWHQSMFCELTNYSLHSPDHIRRVVALYPEYREYLEESRNMEDSYVVPPLKDSWYTKLTNATVHTFGRSIPPLSLSTSPLEVIDRMAAWHDTIVTTCKTGD